MGWRVWRRKKMKDDELFLAGSRIFHRVNPEAIFDK